jgi:hypothetical protein
MREWKARSGVTGLWFQSTGWVGQASMIVSQKKDNFLRPQNLPEVNGRHVKREMSMEKITDLSNKMVKGMTVYVSYVHAIPTSSSSSSTLS